MSSVSPKNIAKQLSVIETALKKMGFKIYQTYGHESLQRVAYHLELGSLTKNRIGYLTEILGILNFAVEEPVEGKRTWTPWILAPYDYGSMNIYLSLEPRSRSSLTLEQLTTLAKLLSNVVEQ